MTNRWDNQTFDVIAQMDLVQRQRQFNGFRKVWKERPDGVFHGLYTVFWETGDVPCMQGEYKDGVQEGIWTYWDRNGSVERQVPSPMTKRLSPGRRRHGSVALN